MYINTGASKAKISPVKNIYCSNDSISFIATGFDSVISRTFAWNDGDGFTSDFGRRKDTLEYVYRKNGNYTPAVYIKDIYGCTDTTNYNGIITVYGPAVDFQSDPGGCTNIPVNFADQSTAGNSAIKKWLWSFGDGGTA